MLETSGSTESTTRPGKGRVGVDGNGSNDSGHVDGGSRSSDSDKNSSDAPKLMCSPTSLISRLRTSISTDSSASAAQIVVEFDGVDRSKSGAVGKSVEKLSKIEKSSKSPKSHKGLKNLQRPLVWSNVYQSTNPLSKNSSFR